MANFHAKISLRRITPSLFVALVAATISTNLHARQPQTTEAKPSQERSRQVVQFGSSSASPQEDAKTDPHDSAATPNSASGKSANPQPTSVQVTVDDVNKKSEVAAVQSSFDQEAAFGYLKEVCDIGPRKSASSGMEKQQKYIQTHFESIGGKFFTQPFQVNSPFNGRQVELKNLLIQWHPERTRRLLICCHHDTRPFADADKRNPRARFIGANDGGSGVALLCELGKHIADMEGEFGVDFMFFDGEEFVIVRQRDPMFLGSRFFAQSYADGKIPWRYEQAVLVDMVADKDLQIYLEGNSMHFAPALTQEIWAVANRLGVKEFIPEKAKNNRSIRDDHLPLNEIAKIPTCDIIDFDYPNPTAGNAYWHTRDDKIQNCSAESLGKVGSVVLEWLREKQRTGK